MDSVDAGFPRSEVRLPSVPAKDRRQWVRGHTSWTDQRGGGVVSAGHVVSQGHQQRADRLCPAANQLRLAELCRHGLLHNYLALVCCCFSSVWMEHRNRDF